MKPIYLQFSNINSYEEEFAVDFADLLQGNIFGIFGPTGSGKSTILDAITLALYGEIPRYTKSHHRGFINSTADIAYVTFRFEIAFNGAPRIYEVKRSYKRNPKTNGVAITFCQLAEIGGEILAGRKESQVNAAVIELIGLDYSDFTRSVFLPQGKFSEFIFLKGDERSRMLERLFDLASLGKRLQDRVKAASAKTKSALDECLAQIRFYGDISGEKLAELNENLLIATEKTAKLSTQREMHLQQRDKFKKLESAYTQLCAAEAELAGLCQNQAVIDGYTKSLQAAVRAEKLRLAIEVTRSLEKQNVLAASNCGLYEKLSAETASEYEKYWQLHQDAQRVFDVEYPVLLKKEQELLGHVALLNEAQALDGDRAALRTDFKVKSAELKQLETDHAKNADEYDRAARELDEIAAQKASLFVSPDEMHALSVAATAERERDAKFAELAAKRDELAKHAQAAAELAVAHASEQRGIAVALAQELADGTPCPVCGSVHHPALADHDEVANPAEYRRVAQDLSRQQGLVSVLTHQIDALTAEIAGMTATSGAVAALDAAFEKHKAHTTLDNKATDLRKQWDELASRLQTLSTQISGLKFETDAITAKGRELAEDIEQKLDKLGENRDLGKLQGAIDATKRRLNEITLAKNETDDLRNKYHTEHQDAAKNLAAAQERRDSISKMLSAQQKSLEIELPASNFDDINAAEAAMLTTTEMAKLEQNIAAFNTKITELQHIIAQSQKILSNETDLPQIPARLEQAQAAYTAADEALIENSEAAAVLQGAIVKMTADLAAIALLKQDQKALETRHGNINEIERLFRANAFVKYLAARHLHYITTDATTRLKRMTGGKFAITFDDDTNFLIRDDKSGGVHRPPASLSGGEVFMVSLCLALALSTKIQMKNSTDIGFFFLDEGFGSLDRETLDVVIDCLEQLGEEKLVVGLITHVEELKHRIVHKIELE